MPTYEYRCPDGHEFEQFVRKISLAAAALPCPVCGKPAERMISAGGGFVFKGSGFYITDYGKDGKKDLRANAAAASSGEGNDAKSKDGTSKGGAATDGGGKGDRVKQGDSAEGGAKHSDAKADSAKSAAPAKAAPAAAPAAPKGPGTDK